MIKNTSSALVAVLMLSACASPELVERQNLLAQDQAAVTATVASDLAAQSGTLVAACIAGLEGRTPNDARISAAPFAKSASAGGVVYSGQWSGQQGFKTGGTVLEVGAAACSFPSVSGLGMGELKTGADGLANFGPRPEIARELERAGYRVSPFTRVSLGGVFLRGALGGLTPGGVQRSLEGTMTATKGGQTVQVEVFAFKEKSNLRVVGSLVTIARQ